MGKAIKKELRTTVSKIIETGDNIFAEEAKEATTNEQAIELFKAISDQMTESESNLKVVGRMLGDDFAWEVYNKYVLFR